MTGVRPPAVAGTFYPRDPAKLEASIRAMLEEARGNTGGGDRPLALIVPHAGYRYSGPVAAAAYTLLRQVSRPIERVVLFGPSHFTPLDGAAVTDSDLWRTPLGDLEIDDEIRAGLEAAGAARSQIPHANEHALEVQLPWLQVLLGAGLSIVPVAVGLASPGSIASLMEAASSVADLLVVSTDLSHYLSLDAARERDRRTAEAVVARNAEAIGVDDACGAHALRGIVEFAYQTDLSVKLLDLRTSGDTAGDPRRVVGYGAFAVSR